MTGRAEDFGLTELFSESSEPPFEEFPLEQFKELFPEGTYTFRGSAIDGTPITASATLTHNFPDGPRIVSPSPTRGCCQTVWWSSGHRSPLQPGSTSPAIRCSWSKKSRYCGLQR